MRSILSVLSVLSIATGVLSHGSKPHRDEHKPTGDWATDHMIAEHHFDNFDPASFFHLHDFDQSHTWTHDEILRTYGINPHTGKLYDDTGHEGKEVPYEERERIVSEVLKLMDLDSDHAITKEEFEAAIQDGKRLPDFKLGTGHHGDDEYEYEIHHFEKYHGDGDVREEDLNHPEDIAHFKKHEEDEKEAERWAKEAALKIIEKNIPTKFRVQRADATRKTLKKEPMDDDTPRKTLKKETGSNGVSQRSQQRMEERARRRAMAQQSIWRHMGG
ncbi:hypothetical protein TWF703_005524 [Orbilia oligospora]|uniref:EF-hand domain-containing protein n=1 Tax=Orbilia oligospora TaxID=2813651 RepID=A0A7C8K047_ORBOL|nr:hypothetical protein TWF703_005524 [Orbilia oligospora]